MPKAAGGTSNLRSNYETRTKSGAGYTSAQFDSNKKSPSKSDVNTTKSSNFSSGNDAPGYTSAQFNSNVTSPSRSGFSNSNDAMGNFSGRGLLGSGNSNRGGSGLLGSNNASQLMNEAMRRAAAAGLAKQYSQYRSPQDPGEDLTRNAYMADQYSQYRSPPAVNPMAPQVQPAMSRDQTDARINAISRGPGSVAGVMPGASPLSQQRTLQTLAGGLTGGGRPISPADLQRLSQTVAGEAGREGAMGQTAVANTMLNRMALADQGKAQYMGGGNIDTLMGQYDATGMRPGTTANQGFKNALLGTDSLGSGMASFAGAASPNSEFNATMPANIRNATHFLTPAAQQAQQRYPQGPRNWSNDPGNQFAALGNHLFGNAEQPMGSMVASARGMPSQAPIQTASIDPAAARPAPQATPPLQAPAQAETGPSFWEQYAPKALQQAATSIDENLVQPTKEQVAKYGGFERAGALARTAVAVMNFLPKGDGIPSVIGYGDRSGDRIPPPTPPAPPVAAPQTPTPPAVNPMPPWSYPQYSQLWNPTLNKYSGAVG